ncbi:MAG: AAA family ATPase [Thermaerobacter sp.]|nr:AAA family ATPase [Thermaerobacter sp.]
MATQPLATEILRWTLDPANLGFQTTAELDTKEELVGQPRAEEAMALALSLRRHGYHIYLSGPTGTGRTTYARRRLRQAAASLPPAEDWLYLPNFRAPSSPEAVAVPAGAGPRFQQALRQLQRDLAQRLPQAFASEEYAAARDQALEEFSRRADQEFVAFQHEAQALGFTVTPGPTGLTTTPLQGERPLTAEELQTLPTARQEELERAGQQVHKLGEAFLRRAHELQQESTQKVHELSHALAAYTCAPLFERLKQEFPQEALLAHLTELYRRIPEWLPLLVPTDGEQAVEDPGWFLVNAFVVRAEDEVPVVYEANPSYYNLMGSIAYEASPSAGLRTSFTLIRPGAVHRANGGYLLIPARELVTNPLAYQGLKRALLHRLARIENIGQEERPTPTLGLEPAPIPLDLQVVLVGPEAAYHELRQMDEQFRKLFKVRVDFAPDMPNTEENRAAFALFLAGLRESHGLRPFAASGVARLTEEAARDAGGRRRLSTRMAVAIELAVEADALAAESGAAAITAEHIDAALRGRTSRSGLYEERMRELISLGTIRIETRGARVGQVNGLTVLTQGERAFGLPARITARTYAGSAGVIDIEREIQLSGPIHSKGVLTLSGYLGWRFGRTQPLSLSASLTIEQNYGGIEGDSASSTELYAILSDLADLPVRQDIAVTGSVDQNGLIQPIGGVNEKIEGFFAVCLAQGLTGTQGCMVPRQNVPDLMLSEEVVEAVAAGKFHIYAIDSIEQGIELLTGVAAGGDAEGDYPAASVFGRAAERLARYAAAVHGSGPKRDLRPA